VKPASLAVFNVCAFARFRRERPLLLCTAVLEFNAVSNLNLAVSALLSASTPASRRGERGVERSVGGGAGDICTGVLSAFTLVLTGEVGTDRNEAPGGAAGIFGNVAFVESIMLCWYASGGC
jgi:hypothetical protein